MTCPTFATGNLLLSPRVPRDGTPHMKPAVHGKEGKWVLISILNNFNPKRPHTHTQKNDCLYRVVREWLELHHVKNKTRKGAKERKKQRKEERKSKKRKFKVKKKKPYQG